MYSSGRGKEIYTKGAGVDWTKAMTGEKRSYDVRYELIILLIVTAYPSRVHY